MKNNMLKITGEDDSVSLEWTKESEPSMTPQEALNWLKEYFEGNETQEDLVAFNTLQGLIDEVRKTNEFLQGRRAEYLAQEDAEKNLKAL